ncbi:MAG: hypothetical protein Q8K55_00475 [Gemmatimonadaceae bacterium]|nr:hypothetical protein [Gemmatimonadaceae bacterium]
MILALHNSLRWLVLLFALVAFVRALKGINGGVDYATGAKRALSIFMISVHLQLLLGIILFGVSPLARSAMTDMGATMKDAGLRSIVVEHPTLMLLGAIVVTVTSVLARRGPDDTVRHRRAAIGIAITLGLILAGIPWERPLLPNF